MLVILRFPGLDSLQLPSQLDRLRRRESHLVQGRDDLFLLPDVVSPAASLPILYEIAQLQLFAGLEILLLACLIFPDLREYLVIGIFEILELLQAIPDLHADVSATLVQLGHRLVHVASVVARLQVTLVARHVLELLLFLLFDPSFHGACFHIAHLRHPLRNPPIVCSRVRAHEVQLSPIHVRAFDGGLGGQHLIADTALPTGVKLFLKLHLDLLMLLLVEEVRSRNRI